MRSIEALKEKARHHEQNEEWQPARDLYMKAIAAMDDEAHLDIGLYNRVGDILVKIGDYEGAVEHYQQATDLYLEAELPNNAIAVCKKVVRHLPGRNEVYLKMGQIRASQGFLVDARQNFLIYATNVEQAGDTEEALRALIEFAALAPDDTEIRLAVAQQLERHDRSDEAIEQLVAAYRVLRRRGEEDQAKAFADRIRAIDPESDPDALVDSLDPGGFEATSLAEDHGDVGSFEEAFGGIDPGSGSDEDPVSGGAEVSDASDDEGPPVVEADFGEIVIAEDVEPATSEVAPEDVPEDDDDPVFDIGGDLPLMPFDDGDEEDASSADGVHEVGGPEDVAESDDWAQDGDDEEEEEVALPFLELETGEVEDAPAPEHPALSLGDVDAEEERSTPPESEPDGAAVDSDWNALRRAYDPSSPSVEVAERLVEAAFQNGESGVVLEAYDLLARALEAAGDSGRAQEVRAQIRSLDPDHPGAVDPSNSDAGGGPGTEEGVDHDSSSDDSASYVDLGSLIFGREEEKEKTTRFQVAYQEPSGDEAEDFANMLAQFKAKVAENFDASDVRAHHDLGTAYKEMGLLNEAVAEFQQALRASADHLPTYELLGQTFMERGEHAAAVRVLERALNVPSEVEDELIGIYYYLGRAHQELGQVDDAVSFYDRVFSLDINFADVTARLRELR